MAVQTQSGERSFDTSAFAAAVAAPEESSFTVLSAELLLKGEYIQEGDDLLIRGALGEEIRVEDYFSSDAPPVLETPAGAMLRPETVDRLLVNQESVEVAGPAGSMAIPGLLGDPIGTIDQLGGDGNVTAKGVDGVVRTLQSGDPVYLNDLVETVGRSFANLRMLDDTSFQLGKETRAIIEDYNYTPGVESGAFEATVVSGFFRYASGRLGGLDKGTHTTIKTPTAQIGVRGSEMEGVVEGDGSSTFVHRDGILDISDANGRGTVTLTEPGTATAVSIRPGAPAPAFAASDELNRLFEEALPPPPDFVVTHDEADAADGTLLDLGLLGEGEEGDGELAEGEFELLGANVGPDGVEVASLGDAAGAENRAPTAVDDLISGTEDEMIRGSLATNDQHGDGKHFWFLGEAPTHGSVVISPDGTFEYTPDPDYFGTDVFTYFIRDIDGDLSEAKVTIDLDPVNDRPEVTVDGQFLFTEGGLGSGNLTVDEVDGDKIVSATITINDAVPTDLLSYSASGDGISGSYVYKDGIGTLTLTGAGTVEDYQQALMSVIYESMNDDPTYYNGQFIPDREVTWSLTDENDTTSTPVTQKVTIIAVNDRPVISGEDSTINYIEGAPPSMPLFDGVVLSPVEHGQSLVKLVFTVTGLADGADESLLVDGKEIVLVPTTEEQALNGDIGYTVSASGEVTLLLKGEWDGARASELVGNIQYRNDNRIHEQDGERVITLDRVQDSGGTEYNGEDLTAGIGLSAHLTVRAVNNAPDLSVTGDLGATLDFVENAATATSLFGDVTLQADAIEAGQRLTNLVIKLQGVVANDQLIVGDRVIDIKQNANDVRVLASGDLPKFSYSVDASAEMIGDSTITLSGDWSAGQLQSLLGSMGYSHSGDDPAPWDPATGDWGNLTRTVSILSLQDDGGTDVAGSEDTRLFVDSSGKPTLSRVIDITPVDDVPLASEFNNEMFYRADPVALFQPVSTGTSPLALSSGEESQHIEQLVFRVAGTDPSGVDLLLIGGTEIPLVSGTGTLPGGGSYTIEDAELNTLRVTLDGDWSNDQVTTLVQSIQYRYDGEGNLPSDRSLKLEKIVDSGGTEGSVDNVSVTIAAAGNYQPEMSATGEATPEFVEAVAGGGDAVKVFEGMTFTVSAGFNEDIDTAKIPAQKIAELVLKVDNVQKWDFIALGDDAKQIYLHNPSLGDEEIAAIPGTSMTSGEIVAQGDFGLPKVYWAAARGNDGSTTLTLKSYTGDLTAESAGWSLEEVQAILGNLTFRNDGNDPAPVGTDPSRTFTIQSIADNVFDEQKSFDPEISVSLAVDPYNQSPLYTYDQTLGSAEAPFRYNVMSGSTDTSTQLLFTGLMIDPVEASQSLSEVVLKLTGLGGSDDTSDGGKEWISLADGQKILLQDGESGTIDGAPSVQYHVSIGESAADRMITLSPAEVDGVMDEGEVNTILNQMRFDLDYGVDAKMQSGVRSFALTTVVDDVGDDPLTTEVEEGKTTISDLVAVIDVMVDADGGATIVNKNLNFLDGVEVPASEKSSQYFEYDETNGALFSSSNAFTVKMRLSAEAVADLFAEDKEFELFRYVNPEGGSSSISSISRNTEDGYVLQVAYDTTPAGSTDVNPTSYGALVDQDGNNLTPADFLDGDVYELVISYDGNVGRVDENGDPVVVGGVQEMDGQFTLSLIDSSESSTDYAHTDALMAEASIVASNFLEPGGKAIFGSPGLTGTLFDIKVESTEVIDPETDETVLHRAHWEMDKYTLVDGNPVVADSNVDGSGYHLTVVDNQLNGDTALEVDTLLVREVVDIDELGYLLTHKQFTNDPTSEAKIATLQIELSDGETQSQVLNPQDLLDLGISTVNVYGDGDSVIDSVESTDTEKKWVAVGDEGEEDNMTHYAYYSDPTDTTTKLLDLYIENELDKSNLII